MTKTAYVFLFVVIALALLLHGLDERSDRVVIHQAAGIALHDGVEDACLQRNRLRDSIWDTAAMLHPNEARRDVVRRSLRYENCDSTAHDAVQDFYTRIEDKSGTKELIEQLHKGP